MPIPVFEQQASEQLTEEMEVKKDKISPWSIFFSILLTVILVVMGEYAFHDADRVFNPYRQACFVPRSYDSLNFLQPVGSPDQSCDLRAYEGTKLMLSVDIGAPLFLVGLLTFLLIRRRKLSGQMKIILFAFYFFVVWMTVRVIFFTESFLVKHYPLYGKYVVFFTVSFLCVALIMAVQKKLKSKSA